MPGPGTFKNVTVGMLRHKGELQHRTGDLPDDARGRDTRPWVKLRNIRFAKRQVSETEIVLSQQLTKAATHRIVCRYDQNITTTMRIKFGTKFYYIGSVDDFHERHRFTALIVSEAPE